MPRGSVEDVLLAALEQSSFPSHAAYHCLFISNRHIFSEAGSKFKVVFLNRRGGCCRAVWVKGKSLAHLERERSRLGTQAEQCQAGGRGGSVSKSEHSCLALFEMHTQCSSSLALPSGVSIPWMKAKMYFVAGRHPHSMPDDSRGY